MRSKLKHHNRWDRQVVLPPNFMQNVDRMFNPQGFSVSQMKLLHHHRKWSRYEKWNVRRVYKRWGGLSSHGLNSFSERYLWPAALHSRHWENSMETLLFLFPQFNYMAPKEEAYFKMFAVRNLQTPAMKENSSRLVYEHTFYQIFKMDFFSIEWLYSRMHIHIYIFKALVKYVTTTAVKNISSKKNGSFLLNQHWNFCRWGVSEDVGLLAFHFMFEHKDV